MKKFVIFVMILIVTVSLGVTVFYFAQDKEELIVNSNAEIFVNQGDTVKFDVELKYGKTGHKIMIESSNSEVLSVNGDALTMGFDAVQGGACYVVIYVSDNSNINPVSIKVNVGNGNPSTPFYVDSEETLKTIAQSTDVAGKNYMLLNDISLDETFTPLNEFSGTLNGNGFTISNLTITSGNATNPTLGGLFSKIATNGVVTNLNIKSVNINGQFSDVGAIAGINEGTISRCSVVDGAIVSSLDEANVGAVCGTNMYSTSTKGRVDRSFASASVTGTKNVGGLVGTNKGGIVINSYVMGNDGISVLGTKSGANVGGLVGYNVYYSSNLATIKNCYTNVSVKKDDNLLDEQAKLGAIIGLNEDKQAEDLNRIMGNYYDSSLVGANHAVEATFTSKTDDVVRKANFRGIYELPKDTSNNIIKNDLNSYYTSTDTTNMVKWDFENVWQLNTSVNKGYPTLNASGSDVPDDIAFLYNPSAIYQDSANGETLSGFAEKVNSGKISSNSYYKLIEDITLTGDFTPIGTKDHPFSGIFDGAGHTITGLKVNSTTASSVVYAGLFGYISSSAKIMNVKIVDSTIESGAMYAGIVVGYNEKGTISNCSVSATVVSTTPRITATRSAGGICGTNEGIIENCVVDNLVIRTTKTDVTKTDYENYRYTGGIAGENGILNSANSATINSCTVKNTTVYNDYGTEHGYTKSTYMFGNEFLSLFDKNQTQFFEMQSPLVHVGGISGINNYKIKNSKVQDSKLTADTTDEKVITAGITAYSKSLTQSAEDPEITLDAVYNTEIKGFYACGIVGDLYGACDQVAIVGGRVYGLISCGIVGEVGIGARVTNGLSGTTLSYYESHNEGCASGLFLQTRYNSLEQMGTVYNCFAYNTFTSGDDNYYDSRCSYRLTNFIGLATNTRRICGKADNLIIVETGNANFNAQMTWGSSTDINNVMGISEADAKMDITGIKEKFQNYSFDVTDIWNFEINEYPTLKNVPQNN